MIAVIGGGFRISKSFRLFHMRRPIAVSYSAFQQKVYAFLARIEDAAKKRFKDEMERLEFEFGGTERLFKYKALVDEKYLKALGLDKPNFMALAQSLTLNTTESGQRTKDSMAEAVASVVRMEIAKSKTFDVPLPDDYQAALIQGGYDPAKETVEAEINEVSPNGKKKCARTYG